MNRRPSCPLQAVMSGMQLHRKTRKINKNVATFSANRHHTKNPETEAKFGVFGPSRLFSLLSETSVRLWLRAARLRPSNSLFQQKTAAQMRIFLFLDGTIPDPSDLERLSFMMLPFLSCAPLSHQIDNRNSLVKGGWSTGVSKWSFQPDSGKETRGGGTRIFKSGMIDRSSASVCPYICPTSICNGAVKREKPLANRTHYRPKTTTSATQRRGKNELDESIDSGNLHPLQNVDIGKKLQVSWSFVTRKKRKERECWVIVQHLIVGSVLLRKQRRWAMPTLLNFKTKMLIAIESNCQRLPKHRQAKWRNGEL